MKAFVCLVVEMAILSSGCVVAIRLQNETWSFTWCHFRFGWISPRHFGLFRVDDRKEVSFIAKKNYLKTIFIHCQIIGTMSWTKLTVNWKFVHPVVRTMQTPTFQALWFFPQWPFCLFKCSTFETVSKNSSQLQFK